MLNKGAHLRDDVFSERIEKKSTRDGFGTGSVIAGKADSSIVVLSADLKESTRAEWFEKEFPDRFIEVGVAEQHMVTCAAGLATVGKIPFVTSYAAFSPGRNYEQIRTTVALNNLPVKVCGMHAGVSVGPDGATHQMLEDIGLMRMLPRMVVINPMDSVEAEKATIAVAKNGQPTYLRFGRSNTPVFTTSETPFEIGKALTLWEGEKPRVLILATGHVAYNALLSARALDTHGISSVVMSFSTIKPLDTTALGSYLGRSVEHIVTIEEHQTMGGFGSAVLEALGNVAHPPVTRLGIQDSFGQSGDPDELIAHYGLDAGSITASIRALFKSQ